MTDETPSDSSGKKTNSPIRTALAAARERRRPSGLEFAVADRIEFLNARHWDVATRSAGLFMSRDYLSTLAHSGPQSLRCRYGVIYREDTPVAAISVQCLTIDGTQLVQSVDQLSDDDRAQLAIRKLGRRALGRVKRRVMVCGNLLSWGPHGVAFADGEDPSELWPAVAEALYRIRRADRLHGQTDYVLIKDLSDQQCEASDSLTRFNYRRVETEPDMVLDVPAEWASFDDYLASLNKKYRKSARNVIKAIDEGSGAVVVLDSLSEDSDRMNELYAAVAHRADVRLAEMPAEFLPALAESLGPDVFAAIGIRVDGQLAGFVTVLKDGETAIGYYLGVDYEVNDRMPLYHRLLYSVIEQAIAWQCRCVSFGRTALEPKARLGCHPVSTSVWIRHRVPVVNLIVRQLLKGVPHEEPPERNPFKAQPQEVTPNVE
jgi:hypothetical protein